MSTPPPPVAAPVPPAAQPAQPSLSEVSRLMNVFIAPRKTFEDLKRNASWWVPWLVAGVFTVLMGVVIIQKVDLAQLAIKRMEMSKFGQTRLEQMTPEQKDQMLRIQVIFAKVRYLSAPVFSLVLGLIMAAILMGIFNFGFAAEIPFGRALAVVFYGGLPGIVKSILVILGLLFSSDPSGFDPDINPVATNPAFFMNREANKFLYGVASGFDVIAIWTLIVVAIGFAAASNNKKLTTGTTLGVIVGLYALIILAFSALGAAF